MLRYKKRNSGETLFRFMALFASLFTVVFLFAIIISIFTEGHAIFRETGFLKFIFSKEWYPAQEPPEFGIGALIAGSFLVTVLALFISVPLGVGSAIYISEIARPGEREVLKPFVELLAGIPSVIYGLFGMAFLSPFIRKLFNLATGLNAFNAGIILGIMTIPIISSISEDALNAVPRGLRFASYALGANRWETITRVVLPTARSGIFAGILLGFGRAVGETMVVLMVAGNSITVPRSIFQSVRPMTSTIAAEMGETVMGSPHFQALFGIGIVLFIITLLSNLLTEWIRKKVVRI